MAKSEKKAVSKTESSKSNELSICLTTQQQEHIKQIIAVYSPTDSIEEYIKKQVLRHLADHIYCVHKK